ncbi:MAG: hypothetical protein ACRECA_09945, partial [Pseudolabrys sp.]
LVEAIDGRLASGIADRQKKRQRRVRRLIAAAASRAVHGFMRDTTGGEIESIIKSASIGEIDVPTAVERALAARALNSKDS